jgi:hypothetical protein
LWCNGPAWLQLEETSWPKGEELADTSEKRKTAHHTPIVSLLTQACQEGVFTKSTSWNKLQRVTAYCLGFIHNCRHKNSRLQGALSPAELNEVTLMCIKRALTDSLMKEKADVMEKGSLSGKSSLLSSNPFLDGKIRKLGADL